MSVMNALSLALVLLIAGCVLALFLGVQSAETAPFAPDPVAVAARG